ncbi:MAG TPA: hypothetical protein VLF66_13400 [Thermoanaerobaculia bacterium]|nr:hypothetical protein [Thermoanaerobaculia bacterium]
MGEAAKERNPTAVVTEVTSTGRTSSPKVRATTSCAGASGASARRRW